jgi:hypothetical protein
MLKLIRPLTLDLKNADLDLKFNPIPAGDKYLANSSSVNFTHKENQFNDFTVQTLLPNYLSRPGPTMAKADFNGDGIEDLFIGGAAGQAGALFTQSSSGDFIKKNNSSLEADAQYEDTASEFFDMDGDGDLDLYVGSGGYEFGPDSPWLQDRIYINDGKGNFSKKTTGLPKMLTSTGTVRSSDIDGDGDSDLFVGSRVSPGCIQVLPKVKF